MWKTIDSAPTDGSYFLGIVKGYVPAVVRWSDMYGTWTEFDDDDDDSYREDEEDWKLTHWMELPEGPK